MIPPSPNFGHIMAMSDGIGTFEHAEYSVPRVAEGYCTDDMARVLIAVCREPVADAAILELSRLAYRFLVDAQGVDGKVRNRRSARGRWHGRRTVQDCWGRAMWAFGTAAARAPEGWMRLSAASAFERGLEQRTTWPRAMSFAALGAAELLTVDPRHRGARRLLSDAADTIGRPAEDPAWAWPEPRLTYANAALADALIAAGAVLGRADVLDDGLTALRWLLARETRLGHLSPTAAGGAGPGDWSPMFDQQAIEAATMADACARAFAVTDDHVWHDGLARCVEWFLGVNDVGVAVGDFDRGAGYDGLTVDGVNRNEGTESTLALLTTLQHARAMAAVA